MKRLTINLSDDLYDEVEKRANESGATRSSICALAISEYLDQKKMLNMMPEMMRMVPDILKLIEATPAPIIEEKKSEN